jgi:hypothetical protein
VECCHGADNIDNGIQGTYFVEMNLLKPNPMYLRLSVSDGRKDCSRFAGYGFIKGAFLKESEQRRKGTQLLPAPAAYRDLAAVDGLDTLSFYQKVKISETKLVQFIAKQSWISTAMDEGTEQHIAADAGKAVSVTDFDFF